MSSCELKYKILEFKGQYQVHFEVTGDIPDRPGKLSVSRRPDHNFHSLDAVAAYNGAGPSFNLKVGAQKLVERVHEDFKRVINHEDPSTNPELVNRGEVWPKSGFPPGWSPDEAQAAIKEEVENGVHEAESGSEVFDNKDSEEKAAGEANSALLDDLGNKDSDEGDSEVGA